MSPKLESLGGSGCYYGKPGWLPVWKCSWQEGTTTVELGSEYCWSYTCSDVYTVHWIVYNSNSYIHNRSMPKFIVLCLKFSSGCYTASIVYWVYIILCTSQTALSATDQYQQQINTGNRFVCVGNLAAVALIFMFHWTVGDTMYRSNTCVQNRSLSV